MQHIVQVSASDSHTLALDKNGVLWSWGYNPCGALGIGNTEDRVRPVRVNLKPLGQRKVVKIATRHTESFLLADDGTVWSWGEPNIMKPYCRVRDILLPTQRPHLKGITDFAVGRVQEVYLKKDGSAWMMSSFQNGPGYPGELDKPVKMLDDVMEVAAGEDHLLFLKKDGTVWSWGKNKFGQLGDGTTETRK